LLFVAATAPSARAAELSQQVVRIHVQRGETRPASTLEDCIAEEFCIAELTFAIKRAGGNPGLLREPQRQPRVTETDQGWRYDFAPPEGERFCRAELVNVSVAPGFGAGATAMRFEASTSAASVNVTMTGNAPRAWFEGVVILLSSRDGEGCTLTGTMQSYECKGRCTAARF
jgi:hypothetical protein